MTRAQLDRKPAEVSAMFDKVADRYDLLNDVLSLGQDRYWRGMVARAVGARPGELVLDLAAGTGTSSRTFTGAGARCVACDFSLGHAAGRRPGRPAPSVRFVAGDALDLPFADAAFDAVTISFGLRNVADTGGGAGRDAARHPAGRPPGDLRVQPPAASRRWTRSTAGTCPAPCPRWPGGCRGNAEAYDYLAESIRDWPAQRELADRIRRRAGRACAGCNLSLGVVALHLARRRPPNPAAHPGRSLRLLTRPLTPATNPAADPCRLTRARAGSPAGHTGLVLPTGRAGPDMDQAGWCFGSRRNGRHHDRDRFAAARGRTATGMPPCRPPDHLVRPAEARGRPEHGAW